MGNGAQQNTGQVSLQNQMEVVQKKAVKSQKYPPFSEIEIKSLLEKFKDLDENSRGSITLDEMKNFLELRMHFFRDRIFAILMEDMEKKSQITINFDQFIKFLTVFHPQANKEEKEKFMFRVYDFDSDGVVTQEDLKSVFELIYMKSAQTLKQNNDKFVFQTNFMNREQNFKQYLNQTSYVTKLGKDVMNIVDADKSNSIDFLEFVDILTDTDIQFRMTIIF